MYIWYITIYQRFIYNYIQYVYIAVIHFSQQGDFFNLDQLKSPLNNCKFSIWFHLNIVFWYIYLKCCLVLVLMNTYSKRGGKNWVWIDFFLIPWWHDHKGNLLLVESEHVFSTSCICNICHIDKNTEEERKNIFCR